MLFANLINIYRSCLSGQPQDREQKVHSQADYAIWSQVERERKRHVGSQPFEKFRSPAHCSLQTELLHA